MGKKYRLREFLLDNDTYAIPVPLTFRGNKTLPTTMGGCMTILHFFLTISFLGFTGIELTTPSWNISSFTSTGILEGGDTLNHQIGPMLIPALQIGAQEGTELARQNITKYFTVYFSLSTYTNSPSNYSRGILCSELGTFTEIIANSNTSYCPDEETLSSYTLAANREGPTYSFYTWVSTCENAARVLGTDGSHCAPYQESMDYLNDLYMFSRSYTELADGNFQLGKTTERAFESNPLWCKVVPDQLGQVQMMVTPIQTVFSMNWFWASFQNVEQTFYSVTQIYQASAGNSTYNNEWGDKSLFSFIYSLTLSEQKTLWQRQDVISDISNFGGIMGLMTLVFGQILSPIIDFHQNLELSKSLYTQPSEDKSAPDENQQKIPWYGRRGSLKQKRTKFIYPAKSYICDFIRGNICCCCKCISFCKQSKYSERFDKASSLLFRETDVLGILQQNRLNTLIAAKFLKLPPRAFYRWFNSMTLKDHHDGGDEAEVENNEDDGDIRINFLNIMDDNLLQKGDTDLKIIELVKQSVFTNEQMPKEEFDKITEHLYAKNLDIKHTSNEDAQDQGLNEQALDALLGVKETVDPISQENQFSFSNQDQNNFQEQPMTSPIDHLLLASKESQFTPKEKKSISIQNSQLAQRRRSITETNLYSTQIDQQEDFNENYLLQQEDMKLDTPLLESQKQEDQAVDKTYVDYEIYDQSPKSADKNYSIPLVQEENYQTNIQGDQD